jgi:uncharacterized protein YjiK
MRYLIIIIICLYSIACAEAKNDNLKEVSRKSKADNITQFYLSTKLNEISGLCLTDDGRLFAHNDEKGAIHQLDPTSGKIIKSFFLGRALTVNQDFEGIAFAKNKFYLVSSDGLLYVFNEGEDNKTVQYQTIDLNMNSKFNVEGLCYDADEESLLVACKDYAGKNFNGNRTVYSVPLNELRMNPKPRFVLSLKELKKDFDIKDFFPSAIERSVDGESFYILSSKGDPCIVQVSAAGEIIEAKRIPKKLHRQPEGLTFLPDGTTIIADEASGKRPTLTIYKNNPLNN